MIGELQIEHESLERARRERRPQPRRVSCYPDSLWAEAPAQSGFKRVGMAAFVFHDQNAERVTIVAV